MNTLDKEKIGLFITELRKEKNMTQKEMAERLFVSDKAVSKWERGLSLPDVSLLIPLAELLEVSTAEILQGERLATSQMEVVQVEELVNGAIQISDEQEKDRAKRNKWRWKMAWVICAMVAGTEVGLLWMSGIPAEELQLYVVLIEGLSLLFSGYFCFFIKERLPDYYDSNAVHVYSDGVFRMNLPGIRFTNNNWPHVVAVGRIWLMGMALVFPGIYMLVRTLLPEMGMLAVTLFSGLSFFIPMMWAAKRYE